MTILTALIILLGTYDCANCFHIPLGTIQVEKNFFVGAGEVSNSDYLQYLLSLKEIHGDSSSVLLKAVPKIRVLDSLATAMKTTPMDYLMSNKFKYFPVLAVDHQHAADYCAWWSERVYEMMKGMICLHFEEMALPINPDNLDKVYPFYRLPTPEEWDNMSRHKRVNNRFQKKIIERPHYSGGTIHPYIIRDIEGLYGSISEMTSVPGLSKGGSYKEANEPNTDTWDRPYSGPSDWVGFRCVCEWKMLE